MKRLLVFLCVCLATSLFFSANAQNEKQTIIWGYGYGQSGKLKELSPEAEIVTYINDRFDVSITPKLIINGQLDKTNLPDFFITDGAPELYASGLIRDIPSEMIEMYAPNYANVLSTNPFGWDINKVPKDDAYLGLNLYNSSLGSLQTYSAYRLDWLERLGINYPGAITEVSDSIYFSKEAYSQAQFIDIIRAFTNDDPDENGIQDTFGMLLPKQQEYIGTLSPLMGMFGLNRSIVNDNGSANIYYASHRYKNFMRFLSYLQKEGLLTVAEKYEGIASTEITNGKIGWNPVDLFTILNYDIAGPNSILKSDPEAKLLITPPELGESGEQGVGILSALPYQKDIIWVVGSHVSDIQLAKILEVFDGISFDPEVLVTVRYGIEGEDFKWEGEPYNSRILQFRYEWIAAIDKGVYSLYTFIQDGEAGKVTYDYGINALSEFALSEEGKAMLILPFKEDVSTSYTEQLYDLNANYEQDISLIAQEFYLSVISGQADVDSEWDTYLDNLYAHGLSEYQSLFELYPTVSP